MRIKLFILFFLVAWGGFSQVNDTIYLSFTKSAFIIFSSDITDAVIGSEQVLVQQKGNKIILQAAQENFDETNLMVQAGDKYYMFIIRYNPHPTKFLYDYQKHPEKAIITDEKEVKKIKQIQTKKDSLDSLYLENCKKVAAAPQNFFDLSETKGDVSLILSTMYVDDQTFYFKVDLINNSKIRYDIDYYQFTIRNKKKALKKTPIQDEIIKPLYVYNDVKVVEAKSHNSFIFVLPKFTIQDKKKLYIEFWENRGDRNFSISLKNNELLKIKPLKK